MYGLRYRLIIPAVPSMVVMGQSSSCMPGTVGSHGSATDAPMTTNATTTASAAAFVMVVTMAFRRMASKVGPTRHVSPC